MHYGGCIAQSQSNPVGAMWSADTVLVLGVNVILESSTSGFEFESIVSRRRSSVVAR